MGLVFFKIFQWVLIHSFFYFPFFWIPEFLIFWFFISSFFHFLNFWFFEFLNFSILKFLNLWKVNFFNLGVFVILSVFDFRFLKDFKFWKNMEIFRVWNLLILKGFWKLVFIGVISVFGFCVSWFLFVFYKYSVLVCF